MPSQLRAAIYVRVSTDQQESNTSLETQFAACERACEGYTLVQAIRDTASGATLERPGLADLRALVRAKQVDVVVAYAVDRLSRNQNHIGILFDEFQRFGVRLQLVTEVFEDTAVGRFIIAARAFVGEIEREKIAERTSRGRLKRAAEGFFVGAHPYGYDRVAPGTLAVNHAQALVIQRIYRDYLRNLGMKAIAVALNADGYRTRRGFGWTAKEVRDALQNETYTGVMTYAGTRFPGRVPEIIDRETWERVQERITRKAALPDGQTHTSPYLLSGILRCGVCGQRMLGLTRTTRRTGHVYVYRSYVCSLQRRRNGCVPHNHNADDLDARVLAMLRAGVRPIVPRQVEDRAATLETAAADLRAQMAENDEERTRIARSIARGLFASEAQARAANADVEARRDAIAHQLAAVEQDLDAIREARAKANRPAIAREILDDTLSIPERKRILQTHVTQITVWPGDAEPYVE